MSHILKTIRPSNWVSEMAIVSPFNPSTIFYSLRDPHVIKHLQ